MGWVKHLLLFIAITKCALFNSALAQDFSPWGQASDVAALARALETCQAGQGDLPASWTLGGFGSGRTDLPSQVSAADAPFLDMTYPDALDRPTEAPLDQALKTLLRQAMATNCPLEERGALVAKSCHATVKNAVAPAKT